MKPLTVKDIVRITGITTRTLHYYDRIHLFKPTQLTDKGYRLYDPSSLEKLQMILLLKEIDVSLKEISKILKLTKEEQKKELIKHRQAVITKKQKLEKVISVVDEYVAGKDIYSLQIFDDSSILPLQEQYALEASLVYGETEAYQEFNRNLSEFSSNEKAGMFAEFEKDMKHLFREIADNMHLSPYSDDIQQFIVAWKSNLEQFMTCDSELLTCIAYTYKTDNRFKSYINQYGDDLAEFLHDAIMIHIHE